ncbi:MAG: nucleotidyltransferase [Rhodanobacteraceae bacterium]|nr:MAG: nucleotidyltransferase [Rhodanobacteraceae bacterium]
MTAPSLVILAAGLGSRYGDAKQIAGVGPNGEWLLEYAIHDALAAGFGSIVLVIRPELRTALGARLAPLLQGRADLQFVGQTFANVPAGCQTPTGRTKPLGTGHAVWCCAPLLHGPFAVINADDYYGHDAFALLARHFCTAAGPAMVGYRLDATLSPCGEVNRGLCRVDANANLIDIAEYTHIAMRGGTLHGTSPAGVEQALAADRTVSLNCWGLLPDMLPDFETGLRAFLAQACATDEYFLPLAIDQHLTRRRRKLAVLRGNGEWLGLTYPADHPRVAARLAALHATGIYPDPLWAPR